MSGRNDDARGKHTAAANRVAQIASLNDALRRHRIGGRLAVTAGVIALGDHALPAILQQVAAYDAFDESNDPYGEHDFGSLHHAGARLFWKIDYYDPSMRAGSSDPANSVVTIRVLTIMLAEEY
ncbi:DUF3768 domain-containing protein [Sphingomonas sp. CROZ-RG-20F-R02-07]|uniref:DUF3768 domain-containing protein n=1 Tax=Sphingomonas sp. CROZ-RG-20F-R02-07 TaxID=2914832 RepID=UPI001F56031C|nr:DUF3768 domain-containing protein [Sphingomonas sp. CROZ-RG-20F-R02-07]